MPGESFVARVDGFDQDPDTLFAVEPRINCRPITNAVAWLEPLVAKVAGGEVLLKNGSEEVQAIAAKDQYADLTPLVDPENLPEILPEPISDKPELTYKDITIDPDNSLSPQVRSEFESINRVFSCVFQSDLPTYNGSKGKVEACINVPENLPQSSRLKHVPWYPRTKLVELQAKFDELESKGAIGRPQDLDIDLQAVSPSFLVAKKGPSKGYRLVTSFGHLATFVRNPPTPITSTDQVLRRLSAWKFLITADISSAYHQIPLARSSMKYAGIVSPYKGLRIYKTAAMGMPGSEVALSELTALLFGQMRQDGKLEILMDDLYIGGNTQKELLENWTEVLKICKDTDIRLGPKKVTIAPKSTKVLGWTWKEQGILEVDQHASDRLQMCDPPPTAEGLRGWIGAYRYMASAIPDHSNVLEPLHAAIGDKCKSTKIEWTEDLVASFRRAQESLKTAQPLSMPVVNEQLYMTSDASMTGIGATLHRERDGAVIRYFSKQLSADKKRWLPCELESLAIGAGLQAFLPYFKESNRKPIVYTDSTPCVMAYNKLKTGSFSTSPRMCTFLHEVVNQGATIKYLAGPSNIQADQASRNPAKCANTRCQMCIWIHDKEEQVVRKLSVEETNAILAGNSPMPFKSRNYWRTRQLEDHDLRQVAFYLRTGTFPPKQKHLSRTKRYLQRHLGIYLSDDNVLLAPSSTEFSSTPRFVVPEEAVLSVITIFHHQFGHLAQTPLKDLLKRHFFMFDLDNQVAEYVSSCLDCAAKKDKRHLVEPMSSVAPPKTFGEHFASDVIRRERQKILFLRETATSYTWALLVKSETAIVLEEGLRQLFSQVRPPNAARSAICRTDNAPGFIHIHDRDSLLDIGVKIDLSNKKNKNGNPVAEKCSQEIQKAIVTIQPTGGPITRQDLAAAISSLNSRPRWSTLSAYELWTGRDMCSGENLAIDQAAIISEQNKRRLQTHPVVEDGADELEVGDLVFANSEGSKLKARDKLVVREKLPGGIMKLDRFKEGSGIITEALIPARDLYKPKVPPAEKVSEPHSTNNNPECTCSFPEKLRSDHAKPQDLNDIVPKPYLPTSKRRPIPPAPGRAQTYQAERPSSIFMPFFFPQPLHADLSGLSEQGTSRSGDPSQQGADNEDVFQTPSNSPNDSERVSGDEQEGSQHEHSGEERVSTGFGSWYGRFFGQSGGPVHQQAQREPENPDNADSAPSDEERSSDDVSGPVTEGGTKEQRSCPVQRQRSGSYPPQAKKPGNTNDWSRRDHSILRDLNPSGRPQRESKPPAHLTYDADGQQKIVRTKRTDL